MRYRALAALLVLCCGETIACKQAPWILATATPEGIISPSAFSEQAFKHAAAIVFARIISVETDSPVPNASGATRITHARVQVIEQFKGPPLDSPIRRVVVWASCTEAPWHEGEERLFLLYLNTGGMRSPSGFYELYSWRLKEVPPDHLLIPELRKLRDGKSAS